MCWLDTVQRFKDSFGWSLSLTLLKNLKMEFCRNSLFLSADLFMPLQAWCQVNYFSWGFNIKINFFIPLSDPLLDIWNSAIFLKIYLVLVRPCFRMLLIWIFVRSWKHPFARGLRLPEDFDQCWTTVKVFFCQSLQTQGWNFFHAIFK